MTIRLTVMTYRQQWSRSAKKPRRQTLKSLPPRTEVTDRVVSVTSGSVAPELVDFREITTVIGSRSVESQLQSSLSSARGSPILASRGKPGGFVFVGRPRKVLEPARGGGTATYAQCTGNTGAARTKWAQICTWTPAT